MPAWKSR